MRSLGIWILCSLFFATTAFADEKIVNVYVWSNVLSNELIQQFEKETGIKVNMSTYESNEVLFAKLKATNNAEYDVINPSSYYVDRMFHQNMLEKINKSKLTHFKNLNPDLLNKSYDPHNNYSLPLYWGITGIFINKNYYPANSVTRWTDLWDKKYENQLMLLDDSREVFSMALCALGYSVNDSNPLHIKQAYLKLKELLPNIKIYKSDGVITILVDEDASIGMAWNGDLSKAKHENPNLEFIYPKDSFVIWIDNLAIPKNAPHRENAYKFLDFMLRAESAKAVSMINGFPTANEAGKKLLPEDIRNNPIIYPPRDILRRGQFQTDITDEALDLYEKYWEKLKMRG